MIKKLLTSGLLLGSLITTQGQENKVQPAQGIIDRNAVTEIGAPQAGKTAFVAVQDTLFYFYNKNIYRYSNNFFTVLSPSTGSVQVNTEFGTSYLNPSNSSIIISGARILASRKATSTNTSIPVTVTLYTASPTGVPGASVASASCVITSTNLAMSTVANFTTPVLATGAYFIGYRANPMGADTLQVWLTAAHTSTSTVPVNQRFGESLGFIRNNGNLISTTNYYNTGTPGSDLEPMTIPLVGFTYTTDATISAPNATATPGAYCANTGISFTNTTDGIVNNRQYNFNQFMINWPYTSTITPAPQGDPVHNWSFNGGTPTPTGSYTTANVTHTYATSGSGAAANLNVRYQKGSGSKVKMAESKTWTLQVANCGIVGVEENTMNNNLSVYPNPVVNGKANISGLEGANTIVVYNVMGQIVSTLTVATEVVSVDLSNQPAGTYVIRVTDSSNKSKLVKVINQ
jgi:hypothetical protein